MKRITNHIKDVILEYDHQNSPYKPCAVFLRARSYKYYHDPSQASLQRLVNAVRSAVQDPGHIMITTDGWHAFIV